MLKTQVTWVFFKTFPFLQENSSIFRTKTVWLTISKFPPIFSCISEGIWLKMPLASNNQETFDILSSSWLWICERGKNLLKKRGEKVLEGKSNRGKWLIAFQKTLQTEGTTSGHSLRLTFSVVQFIKLCEGENHKWMSEQISSLKSLNKKKENSLKKIFPRQNIWEWIR